MNVKKSYFLTSKEKGNLLFNITSYGFQVLFLDHSQKINEKGQNINQSMCINLSLICQSINQPFHQFNCQSQDCTVVILDMVYQSNYPSQEFNLCNKCPTVKLSSQYLTWCTNKRGFHILPHHAQSSQNQAWNNQHYSKW